MTHASPSHRSAASRRDARRKQRRAGYTLIEVMTALGVLMIGATGIFAIQTGATVANMEARRMGTANQVAQMVIERVRRDALLWRSGGANMNLAVLAPTTYLVNAPTAGAPVNTWSNLPVGLNAFDYYGNNTTVSAQMAYCAQSRLAWVYFGQALRVDVRVYFPRRGDGTSASTSDARVAVGCPALPGPSASLISDLHFVHASTVVRWTPAAL